MALQYYCIVGPTASGKTDYALRLARKINGEIVSADSRQIYRHLRIGTATPRGEWTADRTRFESDGIPVHLVDFLEPERRFSAAEFAQLATETIRGIEDRGRSVILAGGTGFYFRALLEGLAPLPTANEALRSELRQMAESRGRPALHDELRRVDPESAERIPANNLHRLIRALEVYRLTGKTLSRWHQEHRSESRSAPGSETKWKRIGLDPGALVLKERIERRCREMLVHGLIEETQKLLEDGHRPDCPALSGLGYPRVVAFLNGAVRSDELLKLLIRDTQQYAKRQRTWFRHQMKGIEWNES